MRGIKHSENEKRKALELLAVSPSVEQAARELGLPRTTLMTWKLQAQGLTEGNKPLRTLPFRAEAEYETEEEKSEDILILRQKRREEFAEKAWQMLSDSLTLTHNRIRRALEKEEELDTVLEDIKNKPKEELSGTEKQAAIVKIRALQLHTLRELSSLVSTLYDKQAQAAGEKWAATAAKSGGASAEEPALSDADRSLLQKVGRMLAQSERTQP